MTNTEKPSTKAETKKQGIVETPKNNLQKAPLPKEITQKDKKTSGEVTSKEEGKKEKKAPEVKEKKIKQAPKIKKDYAVVNARGLHISTKYAISICNLIRGKKLTKVIAELEQVLEMKKAIPMKGEYAHKKGVKIASGGGKYPKKATENFIKIVKSLGKNAEYHGIEDPIISEAIANQSSRPLGKFGRVKRKRTYVKLVAKTKKKKTGGKK
jgi:large subunit ribosomal protein L22